MTTKKQRGRPRKAMAPEAASHHRKPQGAPVAELLDSPSAPIAGEPPPEEWYDRIRKYIDTLHAGGFFKQIPPERAIVLALKGREVGLSPLTALQQLAVVDEAGGKIMFESAEMVRALVSSRGGSIVPIEMTDEKCVVQATRGAVTARFEYTLGEARKQGLVGHGGFWDKNRPDMLFARASTRAGRAMFADIVAGLSYTPEEMGRKEPAGFEPLSPPQVASERVAGVEKPKKAAAPVPPTKPAESKKPAQPEQPAMPEAEIPGAAAISNSKRVVQILNGVTGQVEIWTTGGMTAEQIDVVQKQAQQEDRPKYIKAWLAKHQIARVRDLTEEQATELISYLVNPKAKAPAPMTDAVWKKLQRPLEATLSEAMAYWRLVLTELGYEASEAVLAQGFMGTTNPEFERSPQQIVKGADEVVGMARFKPQMIEEMLDNAEADAMPDVAPEAV